MTLQPNRLQNAGEASHEQRAEHRDHTLADRLAEGPLPLPLAIRYAADVAATLRELHYDGRPHGWVNPSAIVLLSNRAVLRSGNPSRQATLRADIAAFGTLCYEMINGRKMGLDVPLPVVPRTVPRMGPEGLKMAANRLASRCLSDDCMDMQKAVTEMRLLRVLMRQLPAHELQAPVQAPSVETPQAEQPAEPALQAEAPQSEQAGAEPLVDDSSPNASNCPRCGSAYIHVSKPRSKVETLLRVIGSPVYRCHRCYHRYFMLVGIHFAKSAVGEKFALRS